MKKQLFLFGVLLSVGSMVYSAADESPKLPLELIQHVLSFADDASLCRASLASKACAALTKRFREQRKVEYFRAKELRLFPINEHDWKDGQHCPNCYLCSEREELEKNILEKSRPEKHQKPHGLTPLYLVVTARYPYGCKSRKEFNRARCNVIDTLLTRGAKINQPVFCGQKDYDCSYETDYCPQGEPVLHHAVRCSHGDSHDLDLIQKLLDCGANVDSLSEADGATPLYRAIEGGRTPVVKLFLSRGARVDVTAKITFNEGRADEHVERMSPLEYARIRGKDEIVALLEAKKAGEAGAEIVDGSVIPEEQYTPILGACMTLAGNKQVVVPSKLAQDEDAESID